MDINFPLVLVSLVGLTGLVVLFDRLFLLQERNAAQEKLESSGKLDSTEKKQLEARSREPGLVDFSRSFFPVLLVVLVLRSFVVEPFKIPSTSMEPTLVINDFILVNKFHYGLRLPVARTKIFDLQVPKRGDVMVFFPPNDKRYFIKRVIGLPGDNIRLINNVLYINGEEMPQELRASIPRGRPTQFIMEETLPDGSKHLMKKQFFPSVLSRKIGVTVPEGHYFVLGDNRDKSSDSRSWGFVPEANIVGKAFAVWMHWEGILSLPKFHRNGRIVRLGPVHGRTFGSGQVG
jgi:signal peptidase I